jgi:hypothetical protein
MPTENLKSKLDGNKLDLSLSNLTTVPVKELFALPTATCLDMSCNLLTSLPADFCTLIYLVRIDLSQNQLTELPENFGHLQKLQQLDLYQNQLRLLPISFCRLNALKWLDIRDNPLEDSALRVAAGDCLSDVQCRNCAKQVVTYMKKVQSDHERERQKRLKEERELEAARKAEEEREAQRKRAEKKAEREEQRRQRLLKQAVEKADGVNRNGGLDTEQPVHDIQSALHSGHDKRTSQSGLSCVQFVLAMLLLGIAVVCGLYVYCRTQLDNEICTFTLTWFQHNINVATNYLTNLHI